MSDKPLGFEYQPIYEGSCGAYALGHALNLIGITGEIENHKYSSNYVSISRSASKHLSPSAFLHPIRTYIEISANVGTSERGVLSGIKKSGCLPITLENYSRTESRKLLDNILSNDYPIILFSNWLRDVDDDGHWFVCAGKSNDKYIIIDSSPQQANKRIISLYTWDEISRRSIFFDEESSYFQFYGFAIQPKDKVSAVPHLHKVLPQLFRDDSLREWWGYYLEDLRYIFDKTGNNGDVVTAKDFFTRYSRSFIENVSFWSLETEKQRFRAELKNYELVATAYDFALSKTKIDEALIRFSSALTTAGQIE
ncbi:MAG: hypothetical protein BroJett005_11750 [Ignavibacteriota bacterium]|nr:MAG: hypothetical protein BroJett005_11750 [Ignavibacteriota bacterium]